MINFGGARKATEFLGKYNNKWSEVRNSDTPNDIKEMYCNVTSSCSWLILHNLNYIGLILCFNT